MNVQPVRSAAESPPSPRRGLTLLVVAFAAFLTMLDNTIVTVALPAIRAEFGLSLAALEWVATGYILTFSGVLLTGGRLADVWGRRTIFLAGFAIFTVASLAAGLAGGAVTLVAARIIQGIGAGLLLPATLAILSAGRDERQRSLGVAVWMAVAAAALALGPVLGGALSQYAHWSWVFLINVPVGVAAIAVGRVAIPESRAEGENRVDLPGLATSTTALAALTFALVHVPEVGWTSPRTVLALGVAVTASVLFVAAERRAPFPMVVPSMFAHRAFSGGVVAQVLWGLGVNGVFFFTSIFLQDVMGFSPTGAGMAFLPLAALIVAVAPCAPALARRYGANVVVATGLVLVAAGIAGVTLLRAHHGYLELLPVMMTIGVGSALTTPLGAAVLGAMADRHAGVASGVFSASREVSGIFGIAAVGVLVTLGRDSALARGSPPAEAFMHGYSTGLFCAAALVAVGAALSLWALPRRGA